MYDTTAIYLNMAARENQPMTQYPRWVFFITVFIIKIS